MRKRDFAIGILAGLLLLLGAQRSHALTSSSERWQLLDRVCSIAHASRSVRFRDDAFVTEHCAERSNPPVNP
jgi:hypothetical protein